MQFTKTKLKNGLRLITVPMKDNQTVTVVVLVETGSKYETKKNNGISHFLEHMCFKGTVKRPSAYAISVELDSLGSQSNAFTAQEYTGYYAKSDAKHFATVLDIVSDVYLNSTFPEAEIEKEKGVIVEEINMYEDMPHRHIQDLFMGLLYGNQPAGWNIAGTRDNVRAMKRKDFLAYHSAHYVPLATTVIVSGNVDPKIVERAVTKIFGTIPNRKKENKKNTVDKQNKPEVLVKHKATDQTHLVLGVRTFDLYDKRGPALQLLSTILSGGMSSRLFIRLREELGVCYYVRSLVDGYSDHGVLQISAGVTNERIHEVIKEITEACTRIVREGVSEEELTKAKEYLVGNMFLELESSDAWANFYGAQEIYRKKIEGPKDIEQKIRKVKTQDIKKLAEEIFIDKHLNLAIIGPYQNEAVFKKNLTFGLGKKR